MATIEHVRDASGAHMYAGFNGDAYLGRLDCRNGSWIADESENVGLERLEALADAGNEPAELARVAMQCYQNDQADLDADDVDIVVG